MTESVTITLPLPSKYLSPNNSPGSRGGGQRKARIAKSYRNLAWAMTIPRRSESWPWETATVTATFFHKVRRKRDVDNHNAMLKPARDGLVDAGLLVDDDSEHLTTLPCSFRIDKINPRVELTIRRIK